MRITAQTQPPPPPREPSQPSKTAQRAALKYSLLTALVNTHRLLMTKAAGRLADAPTVQQSTINALQLIGDVSQLMLLMEKLLPFPALPTPAQVTQINALLASIKNDVSNLQQTGADASGILSLLGWTSTPPTGIAALLINSNYTWAGASGLNTNYPELVVAWYAPGGSSAGPDLFSEILTQWLPSNMANISFSTLTQMQQSQVMMNFLCMNLAGEYDPTLSIAELDQNFWGSQPTGMGSTWASELPGFIAAYFWQKDGGGNAQFQQDMNAFVSELPSANALGQPTPNYDSGLQALQAYNSQVQGGSLPLAWSFANSPGWWISQHFGQFFGGYTPPTPPSSFEISPRRHRL